MKGPSAYCGGLWLAALSVAVEMATENGEDNKAKEWSEALEKARAAYHEKLWSEENQFFKFDVTEKGKSHEGLLYMPSTHFWILPLPLEVHSLCFGPTSLLGVFPSCVDITNGSPQKQNYSTRGNMQC